MPNTLQALCDLVLHAPELGIEDVCEMLAELVEFELRDETDDNVKSCLESCARNLHHASVDYYASTK